MSTSLSRRDLMRRSALILGGAGAATLLGAGTASALCTTPLEEGIWTNLNPATRSIRRIRLRFQCQDQILNGQPYPPGAPFYVTIWAACHPSSCFWGERPAHRAGGYIVANYDHGFATRVLRVRAIPGGRLAVRMHTDFRDGRADYDTVDIFRRV
jgi:hypothetical protein